MRINLLFPFLIVLISSSPGVYAQEIPVKSDPDKAKTDTLMARVSDKDVAARQQEIFFSPDEAVIFLRRTMHLRSSANLHDPLLSAIGQLIFEASNPPFDSAALFLRKYLCDSIAATRDEFYISEPMRFSYSADTIPVINQNLFSPLQDNTGTDSIRAAIVSVLDYVESRDSSRIRIKGTGNREYSLWINSKSDKTLRFWLNNDLNDSVTVWISNPAHNTVGLYLENGVGFRRPSRQGNVSKARINLEPQDNTTLRNIPKILTKQQFWKTRTEASFILNQAFLTNWVKGGESSVSTALDITWFADYNNRPMLISSSHFARIKYGLVASVTDGIRKNLDLLETNSKLNHKAFGKFDFSGIMLFKTQVSKGYNYPNDSVPVSRFFNPAILTMGLGLDYRPDRHTSINFSPFSYKATFVPDTATIDQTKYGVPSDRRSMHEPGASLLISNEFRPFKSVTVTNRLQLFTNYINNPQNIDVDWEMILKASLNWFTEVRLNTHLIYDDDTKTPVFDNENNPVTGSDGLQKKAPRVQFKELVGFSFVFRF